MNIADHLRAVSRLFLDTAPVIYFVEKHPRYFGLVQRVFEQLDLERLQAVTSPITLAECLIHPYRLKQPEAVRLFTDLMVHDARTHFVLIDQPVADKAAQMRADYNLTLPDALQVAVALHARCDGFLTNDPALKRVTELNVIVLDEVELD